MISRGEQIIRRAAKPWGRVETGQSSVQRLLYEQEMDRGNDLVTAFVELRNQFVPVWRPLSNDQALWRPIYHASMARDDSARTVRPKRDAVVIGERAVRLPMADLRIDPLLERHLSQSGKGNAPK